MRAARRPAREAAPQKPEETPWAASAPAAAALSASVTVTAASRPSRRQGQARLEGVPQFRPAMVVPPVGTVTGRPARRLCRTPAALSGSTDSSAAPSVTRLLR